MGCGSSAPAVAAVPVDPPGSSSISNADDSTTASKADTSTIAVGNPTTNAGGAIDEELVLLHFNDVYNIECGSNEPVSPALLHSGSHSHRMQVGGAARFTHRVKQYRKGGELHEGREPLVVFSGDAFNPSLTSTGERGATQPCQSPDGCAWQCTRASRWCLY